MSKLDVMEILSDRVKEVVFKTEEHFRVEISSDLMERLLEQCEEMGRNTAKFGDSYSIEMADGQWSSRIFIGAFPKGIIKIIKIP